MNRIARKLIRHLTPRKRRSWSEMPTGIILALGLLATLEAGYYGYVLQKFAPGFLDIANTQPISTWASVPFAGCLVLLSAVGFQFFVWSIAAAGSVAILQKRIFGV